MAVIAELVSYTETACSVVLCLSSAQTVSVSLQAQRSRSKGGVLFKEREARAVLTGRRRLLLLADRRLLLAGDRRAPSNRRLSITHGLVGAFALVLMLASAASLLACGGGAAPAPAAGSSSTSRPPSAGAAMTSSAAAFKAYVTQIKPLYLKAAAALSSASDALAITSASADASWGTAAAAITAASGQLGQAVTGFNLIPAPMFLAAAAHAAVEGFGFDQQALSAIAQDLRRGSSPAADTQASSMLSQAATLTKQWKAALQAGAKQYSVSIPWQWGVAQH
jgi:hypothetical protein